MNSRRACTLFTAFGLTLAIAASGAACHRHPVGPIARHQLVGEGNSALRDAFNAAAGRVRVVALVSPT